MADPTKTAEDTTKNPTGATGALTGKDSAVGGLTGGRKPGPANNRSDDDENSEKPDGKGKKDEESSSLKIRIQLDLDVEIHLTARVKGDITIGLL